MSITISETTGEVALKNLAELHHLPPVEAVYETRRDGRRVLTVAVVEATAEAWRAALALPAFTPERQLHYTTHKTAGLWLGLGADVRLSYPTAE